MRESPGPNSGRCPLLKRVMSTRTPSVGNSFSAENLEKEAKTTHHVSLSLRESNTHRGEHFSPKPARRPRVILHSGRLSHRLVLFVCLGGDGQTRERIACGIERVRFQTSRFMLCAEPPSTSFSSQISLSEKTRLCASANLNSFRQAIRQVTFGSRNSLWSLCVVVSVLVQRNCSPTRLEANKIALRLR